MYKDKDTLHITYEQTHSIVHHIPLRVKLSKIKGLMKIKIHIAREQRWKGCGQLFYLKNHVVI